MESLVTLGLLALVLVLARRGLSAAAPVRPAEPDAVALARQRRALVRRRKLAGLNGLYRALQLALLRMDTDPDFRRAAARAVAARPVAASMRRRQFLRFRERLVGHFQRCLDRGADAEVLQRSLVELVRGLGVDAYEADYVRQEAERRDRSSAPPPDYAREVERFQEEHRRRLAALEAVQDVELREQLVEAEESRFRSSLLERTEERT